MERCCPLKFYIMGIFNVTVETRKKSQKIEVSKKIELRAKKSVYQ